MRALSIAATGMLAQQLNVEVISNNIANINTTSFKRQRAEFHDLLYQDLLRAGTRQARPGRRALARRRGPGLRRALAPELAARRCAHRARQRRDRDPAARGRGARCA